MLMKLFIETLTGLTFELRVSPAETVMSVKSKIQRAEGISVSQQHLVWQNSELEDHHRLRDYSICSDSTVRLVLGLRGGPLNAPRIPPIRLTPLHFAPVMPQSRPKGSGINQSARISRFPLPTLGSQRLPSTLGLGPANSSYKSGKLKGMNYACIELSTDSKDPRGRKTSGSSTDAIDNPDVIGEGTTKTPTYRLPLIQAPIASTASAPSLVDGEKTATKNCANENWDESKAVDHLTNTLGSLLGDKKWTSKTTTTTVHHSSSLTAVNLASQGSEDTGEHGTAEVSTSSASVLDYPPLITSNSFRSPLTRFDLPSYWRLYEPREVVIPQVSAALASLSTNGEHQNNGVAAGPSGGGHSPPATIQSSSQLTEGEEDGLGTTTTATVPSSTTAATAASILTSLLSTTTGDTHHLSLSYQKNGAEHSLSSHLPYPFHWLRHSSPLSEGALFRGPHLLDSRGTAIFVPGDDAAGVDLFHHASADMDLDADNDNEEGEELSDLDNDESAEETNAASNLYTVNDDDEDEDNNEGEEDGEEEEDDDSLADLEDYLFYYRTGDLLFGPPPSVPLTTTCPPYSYYTTLRDSYATDLWRDLLESSRDVVGRGGGHKIRREERDGLKAEDNQVENSSWQAECKELAEKVNDLKNQMNNVRSRRLHRYRNAGQATDAVKQPIEDTKTGSLQSEINSSPGVIANSPSTAAAKTMISGTPANSAMETGSPNIASGNCFDGRRQRRFGTVTPPELKLLVQPPCQSSALSSPSSRSKQISGTDTTTTKLHESVSVIDGESEVATKSPATNYTLSPLFGNVLLAATDRRTVESKSSDESVSDGIKVLFQPTRTCNSTLLPSPYSRVLPAMSDHHPSNSPMSSQLVVETNGESSKTSDRKVAEKSHTTPSKLLSSPNSLRRKRCSLCLRRTGIVNSYSCRCGRNFCSRHRYAELHACPFDYKAEGRRALLESNPVIAAPKLPKL